MKNKKPIKKIAVIHDLCGIGKAALTNIIPILSVMGYEVCPIPTMLLSTHTGGFGSPAILKTQDYLKEVINHYKELDLKFDAILIGYLGDKKIVKEVLRFISEFKNENTILVFDPIFGDDGRYYSNFNYEYMIAIKEIIKYSDIITPNYTEACYLAMDEYIDNPNKKDYAEIIDKIRLLGCNNIIITSILEKNDGIISTLISGDNDSKKITTPKLNKSYPGTGDIFVSVLLGYLLRDNKLIVSTEKAIDFVFYSISKSNMYDYDTKNGVLLELSLRQLL